MIINQKACQVVLKSNKIERKHKSEQFLLKTLSIDSTKARWLSPSQKVLKFPVQPPPIMRYNCISQIFFKKTNPNLLESINKKEDKQAKLKHDFGLKSRASINKLKTSFDYSQKKESAQLIIEELVEEGNIFSRKLIHNRKQFLRKK